MDCHEFENQVQDLLDQRQDPRSPAIEAHAATCESCHQLLASAMMLLRGVAIWRSTMPIVDLAGRFTSIGPMVESDRPDVVVIRKPVDTAQGGKLSGVLSWGMVATSAAALCFMFWPASIQQHSHVVQRGYASHRVSKTMSSRQAPLEPNLETVLASAGQAYSHLAHETASAAAQDFALLMPSQGFFRTTKSSHISSDPVPVKSSGLLPENVYPVGDSVENALQYLWRVVPAVEKSAS